MLSNPHSCSSVPRDSTPQHPPELTVAMTELEPSAYAPDTKVTASWLPAGELAKARNSGWPSLPATLCTAGVTDESVSVADGLPLVVPVVSVPCAPATC